MQPPEISWGSFGNTVSVPPMLRSPSRSTGQGVSQRKSILIATPPGTCKECLVVLLSETDDLGAAGMHQMEHHGLFVVKERRMPIFNDLV